jgi:hypothetical protein
MPSSMGTSTASQQTTQKSKTAPWGPTIEPLKQITGAFGEQFENYKPSEAENTAIQQLMGTAKLGNPFANQISGLANDLLGGGQDRSGLVNSSYADYKKQAQPYLSQDYLDPTKNKSFMKYMDTTSNDIQNRVNSMFAGAGRDLSGMNQQTLARGLSEGTSGMFANQYNQNVNTQRGMMDSLYNAGGNTAGLLSGLDQTRLGNRSAGVGMAGQALDAQNYGPMAVLQAESMRRGLPINNLGQISNMLLPIAGLGSQSKGTASSVGTQTMSPMQQINGWMGMAGNLGKTMTGFNTGLGGIAQLGSAFGGMFK